MMSSVDSVGETKSDALDFSGGSSLDGGGGLDLGTVGGDGKKCGGERFHCEFNSKFRRNAPPFI